jgi:dolichyl-phosphate beta-glucosyltransferase
MTPIVKELSIVVPVYQAASSISERLCILTDYLDGARIDYELIPVDDGSTDGTADVLRGIGHPRVFPVLGEPHRGKFGAVRAGMARARGRCALLTDADVPYELAAIPYALALVNERGFHLVVGDRNLEGSEYAQAMPLVRRVATWAFTTFVRLLVTSGLHDTQCGFKALRGDVAHALFPVLLEDGFAGDVELLYVALKYNLEIKRVPVRLRHAETSTVRPVRHGLGMLRALFHLRHQWNTKAYASEALHELSRQDYWNHRLSGCTNSAIDEGMSSAAVRF